MPAHYYLVHIQKACDIKVVVNGSPDSIAFLWLYASISLNGYNRQQWGFERAALNMPYMVKDIHCYKSLSD